MTDDRTPRLETLVASLVYLMTHYARTGCPRLASCVAGHMQAVALHPDAGPVLRDICAGLHGLWTHAGQLPAGGDLGDPRLH
jgi:hypothetical protein